jgi:hypothetical protein
VIYFLEQNLKIVKIYAKIHKKITVAIKHFAAHTKLVAFAIRPSLIVPSAASFSIKAVW